MRFTFKKILISSNLKRYIKRISRCLTLMHCDVSCDVQTRLYKDVFKMVCVFTRFKQLLNCRAYFQKNFTPYNCGSIQSNTALQPQLHYNILKSHYNKLMGKSPYDIF